MECTRCEQSRSRNRGIFESSAEAITENRSSSVNIRSSFRSRLNDVARASYSSEVAPPCAVFAGLEFCVSGVEAAPLFAIFEGWEFPLSVPTSSCAHTRQASPQTSTTTADFRQSRIPYFDANSDSAEVTFVHSLGHITRATRAAQYQGPSLPTRSDTHDS